MTGESGARLTEVENRVIDIHRDIQGSIHGGCTSRKGRRFARRVKSIIPGFPGFPKGDGAIDPRDVEGELGSLEKEEMMDVPHRTGGKSSYPGMCRSGTTIIVAVPWAMRVPSPFVTEVSPRASVLPSLMHRPRATSFPF